MANFNYLDFFKTPSENDIKLFIKDINNTVIWTLSPFKIKSSIIQNNNIRINFTNGDFILIDFNNVYESKYALTTLQTAINTLINKVPLNIDKDIELYTLVYKENIVSATFSSIITYDVSKGNSWYHTNVSNNWTASFINILTQSNYKLNATITLVQTSSNYLPNNFIVNGLTQSLKWKNGTYSSTTYSTNVINFTFIVKDGACVQILGNIDNYYA